MKRRRLLIKILLLGTLLPVVAAAWWVFPRCEGEACPSVGALKVYRPPEASRVFAADGSFVADLAAQRRVVLDLGDIAPILRDGMVAVEDRRFWDHGGVDLRGVLRAAWRDLVSLSFKEGFSTITMQLARNVFPEALPMSDQIRRKAWEVYLAGQIEDAFSKREILELYLNQIYLGGGLYGVEAAAQGYFRKPASEVTPAEAALLIALVKSPEGLNPRRNRLGAIRRRNVVLDVMAREGVLTPEQAERGKLEPLGVAPPMSGKPNGKAPAPYFIAAVRRELRGLFGGEADVSGLRVYTGLQPELQEAAREALVAQIRRIESGAYGAYPHATPPEGDRIEPADNGPSPYLQGMFIALDPTTGVIRALVGGRDFGHSQFDRALQARRQPGSAFKPILYATALQHGLPVTARIQTTPVAVSTGNVQVWRPTDHLAASVEELSVRDALAFSSNHAAVRVGEWLGEKRVIETAAALGISTALPALPSIFLGAAEVVPAELVAAYAAFGNGGLRIEPHLITRIEDDEGNLLWKAPHTFKQVLDPGTAFLTLSLLEDVVDRGTGDIVREAGFWLPAAGKTGTTNESKDVWFIGMTPDLVAGAWLGLDEPTTILPKASGGRLAAPVWAEFMRRVYETRPAPAAWVPPEAVVSLPIDTRTGLLATGNCPAEQVRIEYFLPGTEPHDYCPLHPEGDVERFIDRLWQGVREVF